MIFCMMYLGGFSYGDEIGVWDFILFIVAYNIFFPNKLARLIYTRFKSFKRAKFFVSLSSIMLYLLLAFLFVSLHLVESYGIACLGAGFMLLYAIAYSFVCDFGGYKKDDDPF